MLRVVKAIEKNGVDAVVFEDVCLVLLPDNGRDRCILDFGVLGRAELLEDGAAAGTYIVSSIGGLGYN